MFVQRDVEKKILFDTSSHLQIAQLFVYEFRSISTRIPLAEKGLQGLVYTECNSCSQPITVDLNMRV